MTFRPTTRTAVLLLALALPLALGELSRPLVALALALDGVVALAWLLDVILRGRLGFVAREPELVLAVDARLPADKLALARAAAKRFGAGVATLDEVDALEGTRVVELREDTALDELAEQLRDLS